MWPHPIIYDRRNNGWFCIIFEDLRRDKAKFLKLFWNACVLLKKCRRQFCVVLKKETNMRRSEHPEREREREGE